MTDLSRSKRVDILSKFNQTVSCSSCTSSFAVPSGALYRAICDTLLNRLGWYIEKDKGWIPACAGRTKACGNDRQGRDNSANIDLLRTTTCLLYTSDAA